MTSKEQDSTLHLPWSIVQRPAPNGSPTLYLVDALGADVFTWLWGNAEERPALEAIVTAVNAYPGLIAAALRVIEVADYMTQWAEHTPYTGRRPAEDAIEGLRVALAAGEVDPIRQSEPTTI